MTILSGHHPLCDDNGWDHPGECVPETEILVDIIGPDIKGWCRNAIDDWNEADRDSVDQLLDAGGLLVDIIRTVILGEVL
jgi:hypothetical protein